MKKQLLYIPVILAAAYFGGMKILQTAPAVPKGEESEHKEGHDHAEHGEEGHVELSPEKLKAAKLTIEEAGEATIKTSLPLYGRIAANEEALMRVQPRFPGIAKEVRKRLGEAVKKGETVAVVESNESLRTYELKSEIDGNVIAKNVTLGEFVKDDSTLFTVADLSTVWVDLTVFRSDFSLLRTGQEAKIHLGENAASVPSKIDYISPFGDQGTQSMLARCVVPNPKGDLRPGLFVTADIITGETKAPVAVKLAAIQTLKENTVVFVKEGEAFEARKVELGAKDDERVEVLSGLLPGDAYVSDNSFILKAEIGKEEAEHED